MDFSSGHDNIDLRYYADDWGPYSFEFADALPESDTIDSVTVKAYLGKVKPTATLSEETDMSSEIIDSDYTPQVSNNTAVLVKFKYPAAVSTYKGEKATLIFEITTAAGGKYPFYFHSVRIR